MQDGLDLLGLNRPNGSVNYTYDTLNRLNTAKTTGTNCAQELGRTKDWASTYTVDAWGNLTAKNSTLCQGELMTPTTASARNQLGSANYDSAGNLYLLNGAGYTYDAEGHMINGMGTVYTYDGMGERVANAGSKLYWKGVGSTALMETDTTDNHPTMYIFFNGARIACVDPGATAKYYVTDNVGSTEVETDSAGNVLNESLFFPYGVERIVQQNDTANNYRFSGKERDPNTGLDDFGTRYYDSVLGRFMTPDWDAKPTAVPYAAFGDPQTLNLYSYVENGPLNRVDADGHAAQMLGLDQVIFVTNYFGGGNAGNNQTCNSFSGGDWCFETNGGVTQDTYKAQVEAASAQAAASTGNAASEPAQEEVAQNSAPQAQPAQQQNSTSTTTTTSQSTDYVSVSYWPKSAGGFGHIGVGVDTDDTQGFSTANPKTPWWKRLFGAPAGTPEDDLKAHTSPSGEVAPHSYLHIPISADQASATRGAIAERYANGGHYNLIFDNCAQFVESVLHAGGVSGVPHAEVFGPAILGGVLWAEH